MCMCVWNVAIIDQTRCDDINNVSKKWVGGSAEINAREKVGDGRMRA